MKIAFVLSSISRANGGISESVRRLAQSLQSSGPADVSVFGLRDEHTQEDLPLWYPLQPRCLPVTGPRALGYAPGLSAALSGEAADVSHVAGLWMYPSAAHARWARRARHPYVISPHGMLDGWALRNSAGRKRVAARLFERGHLEGAGCLHALCASEVDAIRAFGLKNPVCVVPNGIDLPSPSLRLQGPAWAGRFPADRQVLLFLGRLHPKKGLQPLLRAWSLVRPANWQLVIAGWDQGGHLRELEDLAASSGLGGSVCFCGPLHGPDKAAAYAAAHAFVLPSFSEGLPMTILEAWAYGVPVLMTPACNLPEGFSARAAYEISTDPARMAGQLEHFFALPAEERIAMGHRGRALAARQFSWDRIAADLLSVYRWIMGAGPRPSCVLP